MSNFELPPLQHHIDGRWVDGMGERVLDIVNPATAESIGQLRSVDASDLDRALAAASRSFESWKSMAPADRTSILVKAASLVRKRADHLAWLTTIELGMPLKDARVLVDRAAEVLDWDANEGRRLYGRVIPSAPNMQQSVIREPLGPVAAFSPWNGSVFTPCRKIGSALAAGCTIILKAAEETPMSTIALVRLFEEAGVPPGVLNLVYGDPAQISRHLIESPITRAVSFTGSVPVGKHLAELAARHMKPAVMELGGHAPVLVCADADLDVTATRLVASKYFNAGQVCLAPSRVFVDSRVHDALAERIVARVRQLKVGDGLEAGTTVGPLANRKRLEEVEHLIFEATKQGAAVLIGGERLAGRGYYYAPTVLARLPDAARILHVEPFGPVLTLSSFTDLDEALARANALPYGLGGYGFTTSAARANKIARGLDCGVVGINHFGVSTHGMPFGGTKDSGNGREGGTEGILSYTYAKSVSVMFD